MEAITNFPLLKNISDVCARFDLIQQVANCAPVWPLMEEFCHLLMSKMLFSWDDDLEVRFCHSKVAIANEICHGVEIFNQEVDDVPADGLQHHRLLPAAETLRLLRPLICH